MRCLWPRQIGNSNNHQTINTKAAAAVTTTTATTNRTGTRLSIAGGGSRAERGSDAGEKYKNGRNGEATRHATATSLMNSAGGSVRCARYTKSAARDDLEKQRGIQVTMANYNQKDYDIYYYERDEYKDEKVIIDTIAVSATTTTQRMESGCGSIGANCQECRNIKILLRLSLRYFYDINCEIVKNTI